MELKERYSKSGMRLDFPSVEEYQHNQIVALKDRIVKLNKYHKESIKEYEEFKWMRIKEINDLKRKVRLYATLSTIENKSIFRIMYDRIIKRIGFKINISITKINKGSK